MAEFAKLAAPRYAFGDFVLERAQQEVRRRDGSALDLSPRLFNALLLFVEHAGELLDKDALMRALWPGLVVDENSLSQVVSGLRRALADDPVASRYIQTVPRRGFRFVATVTTPPERTATSMTQPVATKSRCSRFMPPPEAAPPPPAQRAGRSAASTGGIGCAWHWSAAPPRAWVLPACGRRAVRCAPAARDRPRRWPCCLSSRWRRKRATSCSKWAWPTA
jgi:DNA-binding winged helix-turn-helix (wHTH) protein